MYLEFEANPIELKSRYLITYMYASVIYIYIYI